MEYFDYDNRLLESLRSVVGDIELFINAVSEPGSFISIRVNTLKIDVDRLFERLSNKGLDVSYHGVLDDVLLIPVVKRPFDISKTILPEKSVWADKYAAESVLQGANLYWPGLLSFDKGIRIGDRVVVRAPNNLPVAIGISMFNSTSGLKKSGIAVKVLASKYSSPKLRELNEYCEGLFYQQSIPSILAVLELDPKPGEVIVDMCAAPGGKSTYIAQLTRNIAKIYAFDHSEKRLKQLERELIRLGAKSVKPIRADSRYLHIDYPTIRADRVILDPPCSGIGIRPKIYDRKRHSDVLNLSRYQKQFVKSAFKILKPGGILVYSTCTVTLEETVEIVDYAVRETGFRLTRTLKLHIGFPPKILSLRSYAEIFLPHVHNLPGYFIAVLEKP